MRVRRSSEGHVQKNADVLLFVAVFVLSLMSGAVWAGSISAAVKVVNINSDHGGLMVQMDTSVATNFESTCPGNWAFIPSTHSLFNAFLGSLLAAKASQEQVVVYTNGCIATALSASFPKIVVIDYGIRITG